MDKQWRALMGGTKNALKGGAKAMVGDIELSLEATMDDLADLSVETKCESLSELYRRLMGTEMMATLTALRLFTASGVRAGQTMKGKAAAEAAAAVLTISDLPALQAAFIAILSGLQRESAPADAA
jgi:hypothetical protein